MARRAGVAGAALLPHDEAAVVRTAAWLHDIGYADSLIDTGCHPIDGARHLQRVGAPDVVVALVAYHSGAEYEAAERGLGDALSEFAAPPGELLDVLTFADMTTDTKGHGASVEGRLDGILERYAAHDPVHASVDVAKTHLVAAVERVEESLVAAAKSR